LVLLTLVPVKFLNFKMIFFKKLTKKAKIFFGHPQVEEKYRKNCGFTFFPYTCGVLFLNTNSLLI
jgi:hypothetical protein